MSEREEFEKWFNREGSDDFFEDWAAWQACAERKDAALAAKQREIDELAAQVEVMRKYIEECVQSEFDLSIKGQVRMTEDGTNILSISGPAALAEVKARTLEEGLDDVLMNLRDADLLAAANMVEELKCSMEASIRKGEE